MPPFGILRLLITTECSSGPFGSSSALSFSLSFSSFHLAALEWSGLPSTPSVVSRPEACSFTINVALLVSHFMLEPLSKFVFSAVFHDKCSVHDADVTAHAEWRVFRRAFRRTEQLHEHCFLQLQRCKRRYPFPGEKGNL